MPTMFEGPDKPTIYRVSGASPYPDPNAPPSLPPEMSPRQVTLRDRQTVATVVPFASKDQVPASLLRYLADQFNREIEGGDTYPMTDIMPYDEFASYWFQNFGAIMLLGSFEGPADVAALPEAAGSVGASMSNGANGTNGINGGASNGHGHSNDHVKINSGASTPVSATAPASDWSKTCLGSFYIKPNYPGRSSHVCNAGFLVTEAARGRGVGRLMGEAYLDWAPRLGYTYSVFNLVYETNVASCKIWDALGFRRIGRVKGCGNLRSHPDRLVDAIIYGRDLVPGEFPEDMLASEERFDKIKFYLKYGKYPAGADRAEKSRLRSAVTHYKLAPAPGGGGGGGGGSTAAGADGEVLMLKDKEVVPDPRRQYDIARETHVARDHGGINKTTAHIAERYHWSRIKETVSDVIRNCAKCKELGKMPAMNGNGGARNRGANGGGGGGGGAAAPVNGHSGARGAAMSPPAQDVNSNNKSNGNNGNVATPPALIGANGSSKFNNLLAVHTSPPPPSSVAHPPRPSSIQYHNYHSPDDISAGVMPSHTLRDPSASPLSPHQHHHQDIPHPHPHQHHRHHNGHAQHPIHNPMLQDHTNEPHSSVVYQPIDPQMINQPSSNMAHPHSHPHPHPHHHHGATDGPYAAYAPHGHVPAAEETDFQALLNATTSDPVDQGHDGEAAHNSHLRHGASSSSGPGTGADTGTGGDVVDVVDVDSEAAAAREREAVDRDLDMLIEQGGGYDDGDGDDYDDDDDYNDEDDDDDHCGGGDGDGDAAMTDVGDDGLDRGGGNSGDGGDQPFHAQDVHVGRQQGGRG